MKRLSQTALYALPLILLFAAASVVGAADFVPLTHLPRVSNVEDPSEFFNALFRVGLIVAAFLAVVMIAVGGLRYMYATADSPTSKNDAREQITSAVAGLLLIILSGLLLTIINPDILNIKFGATLPSSPSFAASFNEGEVTIEYVFNFDMRSETT